MRLISYAQNFEDVMLWRALQHISHGFYIDVGAQDPKIDSVSLAFYEQGWRGVHIEPSTHYANRLRAARPDETVIEAALGETGGILTLYEIAETGLSTGQPKLADQHRSSGFDVVPKDVPRLTLASVLDRYADRQVHWLKIDVEGMEGQVLGGWHPSSVRPWIVVIEATHPTTQVETHAEWERVVLELGYDPAYFDGLNRFYVSMEHPELKDSFRVGPNVFDKFALSGTSDGPFCSLLVDELMKVSKDLDTERNRAKRLREILPERTDEITRVSQDLERRLSEVLRERAEEIAKVSQDLETERNRAKHLSKILLERSDELALERNELDRVRSNAHQVEIDLARREAELKTQVLQWQTEAERLRVDLSVVYASRSWKITSPLRFVGSTLKRTWRLFRRTVGRMPTFLRPVARHGATWAVAFLGKHPTMRKSTVHALRRWPRLYAGLRRVQSLPLEVGRSSEPSAPVRRRDADIEWELYPSSVHRMFVRLMAARPGEE